MKRALTVLLVFLFTLTGCGGGGSMPSVASSSGSAASSRSSSAPSRSSVQSEADETPPEPYPHVLSVDLDTVVQDNWLGVNGVYHGYAYQPDSGQREYTEAQAQTEFDRLGSMRFHIARTYYNYEYAKHAQWFDWESDRMQAFYRWLEQMQQRGVDVALQAGWWLPGDLTNTSYPASFAISPFATKMTWSEKVEAWAEWVSESLYQMIEVRGFTNIQYVLLFTEPNYASGDLPKDCDSLRQAWLDCAEALHKRLVADGRRDWVQLVGPNEGSTTTSDMVYWAAKNADDYLDVYSSHAYLFDLAADRDLYPDFYRWMKTGLTVMRSTGKPYWFDEYGLSSAKDQLPTDMELLRYNDGLYGKYIALINAAALNLGVQTTLIWTVFDQQWPSNNTTARDCWYEGEHRWGVAPTLRQSETPYPCYYAFSLLSRYLGGEGTRVFATQDDGSLRTACVETEEGQLSLLVVNAEAYDTAFTVTFSAPIDRPLYRHLYDAHNVTPTPEAEIIGVDLQPDASGGSFTDTLPRDAVAIYTTDPD